MVSFEFDGWFQLLDIALRIFVMIDEQGFRLGVGIVLVNKHGKLFFAQRVGLPEAWQFPQGGICEGESPEEGMYRELFEELGLERDDVKLIRETSRWLNYYLPKHMRRYRSQPLCVGQKQKWFLLRLLSSDNRIRLDSTSEPEFEQWYWADCDVPAQKVIGFKQWVYKTALREFTPLLLEEEAVGDSAEV